MPKLELYSNYNVPKEEMPLFRSWNLHRAQAKYRNEAHALGWYDWRGIWIQSDGTNLSSIRGTTAGSYLLVRVDKTAPWSKDNTKLVERVKFSSNDFNNRVKKTQENTKDGV